jgi:transposase
MNPRFNINPGSRSIVASFDVHVENYYLYCVDTATGEVLADCNLPGDPKAAIKHLKKVGAKPADTVVIYEAGGAGYQPHRVFIQSGYDCKIIAPSSIPKRGKLRKTDRADALNNLQYHCSGLLNYVHVLSEEEEDGRELSRFRLNLTQHIAKQKQKVLALVRRSGKSYTETKSNWTLKHYRWLKRLELPREARYLLDSMLDSLENSECQLRSLEKEIDEFVKCRPKYDLMVSLLSEIPGFGKTNAITAALEIQDFSRFPTPNALMSYMGLIPGKHASGQSDPSRRLTKQGNRFLRLTYVGAAKSYRDRRLLRSAKSIEELPQPLQEFVKRMQDRLLGRYRHLRNSGKHSNKARCAVARELCAFTWELFVRIAPGLSATKQKAA